MLLNVRNTHEALPKVLQLMEEKAEKQDSRNGFVFVYPLPLITLYEYPLERVLFWAQRDANPFFHFFEALGFLAARVDVQFYANFAKQIAQYSDDGKILWGNYGVRWREWFDRDQLFWAINRLKKDPNDRRVVISMWDGFKDPQKADDNGKDTPCNTNIFVNIRNGKFCMQVNCRSNDALFGALGANVVHMSMLQEYLASSIGVPMGWYAQSSFNYHIYNDFYQKMKTRVSKLGDCVFTPTPDPIKFNPYVETSIRWPKVQPYPIMQNSDYWDKELLAFLDEPLELIKAKNTFFNDVAVPLYKAHHVYKKGHFDEAGYWAGKCEASDWRVAAAEWLHRRRIEKSNA